MEWLTYFLAGGAALLASWVSTGFVRYFLHRHAILDHPNPRSSHTLPTPRGGGLGVVAVLLLVWGAITYFVPAVPAEGWTLLGAALFLAAISWVDDLQEISPTIRLLFHGIAVAAVLTSLPSEVMIFQGLLPPLLDRIATGLLWIWFLNLFNFMDGIDGIAGVETASLGFGIALVASLAGLGPEFSYYGITIAAVALGFLIWNWPPAKIFLGDVGSIPLGFLLGWLLLSLASAGHWAEALILPLYYLADSTVTLVRRLFAGERIWEAHASHFYQLATRRGLGHANVVYIVLAANLGLIGLAVLASTGLPLISLLIALVLVGMVLGILRNPFREGT
ncbi:MAG: MraY family glycosyltransferase [Alphaproteobacteria bacterium]